ncbi:MAG: hypothetical protein K9L28_09580 [Synergistales bacterium]|nr:hypothetical protein [Synergistales bacterium]
MDSDSVQRLEDVLHSCERVTARLIEAVATNAQLAGTHTKEVSELFDQWVAIIGRDLRARLEETGTLDLRETSQQLGITMESLVTLLGYLHRRGDISITAVTAHPTEESNRELCGCIDGHTPEGQEGRSP